jgi:HD-GYP domain-containing protein (c-di-GMP phosphodiesterase class II)
MKRIPVIDLVPGMVTAEEVRTKGGQLVADKNTPLTKQLILRLTFYNISSVLVENAGDDEQDDAAPVSKPQLSPVYTQKIRNSSEFQNFQIDHTLVLSLIRDSFEAFVNTGKPLPVDQLLKQTVELYMSCKTSLDLFNMLHNLRSSDDSVYAHSLNVALVSRRLGRWLKADTEQLDTLTISGLLHDIGKLQIPDDILNKPGKYTDEEFALVKQHPVYSYELLKNVPDIDESVRKVALCHHERCDGTGYPNRLTQGDLDDYSMIVAIADVYDAMTAARSYRSPLCPFQVISNFEQDGLQKYNPKYILTFLSHIAGTYQNHRVILSDGRSATVVMLNQNRLSKPLVQFNDGTCLDLATQEGLTIQSVM